MIFTYRVTLPGIKGFFRLYKMDGGTTLYAFHKQMRADMEFPQDQLILFKALDAGGGVVGRYGLFDLGSGAVDAVTVAQTVGAGAVSFVYFYDVPNRKSVNITLEATEEGTGPAPVLVDVKGPNPIDFENGYVAFEDLPEHQRHLPGQKPDWSDLLSGGLSDEDLDDADDDDDDADEEDPDDDTPEVFDGTEDLNL